MNESIDQLIDDSKVMNQEHLSANQSFKCDEISHQDDQESLASLEYDVKDFSFDSTNNLDVSGDSDLKDTNTRSDSPVNVSKTNIKSYSESVNNTNTLNVSRYGRERKQKFIKDFYVNIDFVIHRNKTNKRSPESVKSNNLKKKIDLTEKCSEENYKKHKNNTFPSATAEVNDFSKGNNTFPSVSIKNKTYVKKSMKKNSEQNILLLNYDASKPSNENTTLHSVKCDISDNAINGYSPINAKNTPLINSTLQGREDDVDTINGVSSDIEKKIIDCKTEINDSDLTSKDEISTRTSTPWNQTCNKKQLKVYSRKDIIQKKAANEETASLVRNIFSPSKTLNYSISSKELASPQSADVLVIKKLDIDQSCTTTTTTTTTAPKKKSYMVLINSKFDDVPDVSEDDLISVSNIKREEGESEIIDVFDQNEELCGWKVGDLAWARVGSYPLWPCIITRDPTTNQYVTKKTIGRSTNPSFALHVTFFADNSRHCWLHTHFLMAFEGLEKFNEIKATITSTMKKKDPKYCAAFVIKPSKKSKWLSAITEAEMFFRRPLELREKFLYTVFLAPENSVKKVMKPKKEKIKIKPENISLSESLFDDLFSSDSDIRKSELKNEENVKQKVNNKQTSISAYLQKKPHSEDDCDVKDIKPDFSVENVSLNSQKDIRRPNILKKPVKRKFLNFDLPDTTVNQDIDKFSESVNSIDGTQDFSKQEVIDTGNVPIKKRKRSDSDENEGSVKVNGEHCSDSGFQKFVENLRDEHPELEDDKLLQYARKTWQYDDNEILEEIKSTNTMTDVKGMNEDTSAIAMHKRRAKRSNKDSTNNSEKSRGNREKLPRKVSSKSYLCDYSSSSESDETLKDEIKKEEHVDSSPLVENYPNAVDFNESVDVHMESLKAPKHNIFKGFVREKVCLICELPYGLEKCSQCKETFHVLCVEKQSLVMPDSIDDISKGKKKRKKKLSNDCDVSVDLETSVDKTKNVDGENSNFNLVLNVDDFESQLSEKMMVIIKEKEDLDSTSLSSSDELEWKNVKAGEGVIVDVVSSKNKEKSNTGNEVEFKCNSCSKCDTPICFICKLEKSPQNGLDVRQRCGVIHCHQFYHMECLKNWPQTKYSAGVTMKGNKKINTDTISCPRHVCHTCVSDDPQGCKTRFSGEKLARCIRCPATYHSFTQCIPAGSRIVTGSLIICPKHFDISSTKGSNHVNAAWCFICAKGGTLVCCDTCPMSFHAECLNISLPEDGYICEDCETGRLPLYEEIVWVKLGQYRWWPALILHPSDIPLNINKLPHLPGQFAVRFFGVYDHYWINSGRVFPYQEGDTGNVSSKKSYVNSIFKTAIRQAQTAYAVIKSLKENTPDSELSSSFLPPKYVKLKVNRAIGGVVLGSKSSEISKCECNPNSKNPCAPDTDCLNRMLLTECSPSVCLAGERCCNQAFEKRQYPLLKPSRTSERGWGLRSADTIKKGQFIIEYVGEVIDLTEFQRRMKMKQTTRDENYYFLTLDKDRMIDAGPKGNVSRFMNHSCEPNCETQKWTVNGDTRVGLFALEDIPPDTELTFNYNLVGAGEDKKTCLCGSKRCAGYIGGKPKQDDTVVKKPKKVKMKRKYRKKAKTIITKRAKNFNDINQDIELINQSLEHCNDDESKEVLYAFEDCSQSAEETTKTGITSKGKSKSNKRKRSTSNVHSKTSNNKRTKINSQRVKSVKLSLVQADKFKMLNNSS